MHKLLMPWVGFFLSCHVSLEFNAHAFPFSRGEVAWDSSLMVFQASFQLDETPSKSPWVLFANIIKAEGPLPSGLGLLEQTSPFSPEQWRKSSGLQIKGVFSGSQSCSYTLGHRGAWLELGDACSKSHWDYVVEAPRRLGTWGQTSPTTFVFSGPLGPMPTKERLRIEWTLKGVFGECQSCQSQAGVEGLTPLPPLYLKTDGPWPQRSQYTIGNLRIHHRGLEEDVAQDIWKALTPLVNSLPIFQNSKPLHLWLTGQTLATTLVQRQPGDVQLGPNFWLTPPFLRNYHLGAVLRGLLSEALMLAARAHREPEDMQAYAQMHTLTNWLADRVVRHNFNSLNSLKDLSQKLSFLPLFDGIFMGSVLSHNAIMLGAEEAPTALDRSVMGDLFPTLSAKEVQERLDWCAPGTSLHWHRALGSPQDLWNWLNDLIDMPSQKCHSGWTQSLSHRPPQESINTLVEGGRIVATRDWVPPPPWKRWDGGSPLNTDTLEIVFEDENTKESHIWAVPNSRLEFPVNPSDPKIQLDVRGPNTGSQPERHRIPRGVEVKIVDAKVGYSSGQHAIALQGGVRWRILGDEYQRFFTLGAEYKKGDFFISPLISFSLPLFPQLAPRVVLGNRTQVKNHMTNTVQSQLELSDPQLETNPLVPRGGFMSLSAQHRIRNRVASDLTTTLLKGSWSFPLSQLGTWTPTLIWGMASAPQALGGTESLPGAWDDEITTDHHGGFQQKVSWVMATNGHFSLGGWAVLRSLLLAAQYNYVMDLHKGQEKLFNAPSAHTLQWRLTLLSDFLGTKDQSLSAEISHTFNKDQPNIFTLSIGNIP